MKQPGIVRECEHPGKPHAHGSACYKYDGCRCRLGRAAKAATARKVRKLKALGLHDGYFNVDPTGARRRIEALMTLGYQGRELAPMAGLSDRNLSRLLQAQRVQIKRETHEAIVKVYDELWDKPAPECRGARLVRNLAAKRGYVPPMGWDDDTIDDPRAKPYVEAKVDIDWQVVERAIAGKPRGRRLTKRERIAAAQAMARKGATATQISRRLGMSGADVNRYTREVAA